VLALGLVLVVIYLVAALVRGGAASANPYGSSSPEWRVPSPPPVHNFTAAPDPDHGPYDYNGKEHP
jgi:cytochrome c oxidase subunit 1